MSKWHIRYLVYSTDAPELNKWFLFNKHRNILSALPRSSCLTIKGGSCGLWRKYELPPSSVKFSKGLGPVVPSNRWSSSLITGWKMAPGPRTWDFSLSVKMPGISDSSLFDPAIFLVMILKIAFKETHLIHRGGIKLWSKSQLWSEPRLDLSLWLPIVWTWTAYLSLSTSVSSSVK